MIENLLSGFSETHRIFTYLLIFLGMFIEGEFILLLAGIIIRSGHIDFFDTLLIAFIAVVIHDTAFWYLGQKLADKGENKFLFFDLNKIINFFQKTKNLATGSWLFFSKFSWSFNRFSLICSGILKMPYSRFYRYTLPAAFLWSLTFISLGYFFADKLEILKKDIKVALMSFTAFFIVILILEKLFQKGLLSEIGNNKSENNI